MRSHEPDIEAIRRSVSWVGRLSDGIVQLGPFGIGVDGVLSWIPGVGEVYSGLAGAFLLVQGFRAKVPVHVLLACLLLLASRTLITIVPVAGPAASDLFRAHKWAAKLIVRAIDRQSARRAVAEPVMGAALVRPRS